MPIIDFTNNIRSRDVGLLLRGGRRQERETLISVDLCNSASVSGTASTRFRLRINRRWNGAQQRELHNGYANMSRCLMRRPADRVKRFKPSRVVRCEIWKQEIESSRIAEISYVLIEHSNTSEQYSNIGR